ncbi:MAG TPA: hypothetical protein V6D13_08235 [Halomicronema sp.]
METPNGPELPTQANTKPAPKNCLPNNINPVTRLNLYQTPYAPPNKIAIFLHPAQKHKTQQKSHP